MIQHTVIAHRGASQYAPENTLAAFQHAYDQGARWIECDVRLTRDGIPVIFHDDVLERTTNGRGSLRDQDLDALKRLDAGSWFSKRYQDERIPTLGDVLAWAMAHKVSINFEMKADQSETQALVLAVLKDLYQYDTHHGVQILISSFSQDILSLCHTLAPELKLGCLMHTWSEEMIQQAETWGCYSVHLSVKIATASRIQALSKKGFKVGIYTVNHLRTAKRLFSYGADAIFTDKPDVLTRPKFSFLHKFLKKSG